MDIRDFKDYRLFLKAKVKEKRKSARGFSFQHFALKIGTTRSYLNLVVERKRHISLEKVEPIAKYFSFNDFEKQYFLFLFLKGSVKCAQLQAFFQSILGSYLAYSRQLKHSKKLVDLRPQQRAATLRNWISMAVISLALLPDYKHEARWIQKKLGGSKVLTLTEIKQALRLAEESGAFVKENGGWKLARDHYFQDSHPVDLEDFHSYKVGLHRAALALELRGKTEIHRPCRYQMYSLSLSEENGKELMRMYDELDQKIRELVTRIQEPEMVFFVSNNGFALTKKTSLKLADPEF